MQRRIVQKRKYNELRGEPLSLSYTHYQICELAGEKRHLTNPRIIENQCTRSSYQAFVEAFEKEQIQSPDVESFGGATFGSSISSKDNCFEEAIFDWEEQVFGSLSEEEEFIYFSTPSETKMTKKGFRMSRRETLSELPEENAFQWSA